MTQQPSQPSPPPAPAPSPVGRSGGSIKGALGTLVIALLLTGVTLTLGSYAYRSDWKINHSSGTVASLILARPGVHAGVSSHYVTELMLEPAHPGQRAGPFRLAGDQRDLINHIQGRVKIIYDHQGKVMELKDEKQVHITLDQSIRKRHIARVVAMGGFLIMGMITLSQWMGFFKSLRRIRDLQV